MSDPLDMWAFLPVGYLFSVLLETPVLLLGLSERHTLSRRLFAGLWLTACSYPVVILVLPQLIDIGEQRTLYLLLAETFAPVSECVLFWFAFRDGTGWRTRSALRDAAAITIANLLSFGVAEGFYRLGG